MVLVALEKCLCLVPAKHVEVRIYTTPLNDAIAVEIGFTVAYDKDVFHWFVGI
jgi:hypothetical protein